MNPWEPDGWDATERKYKFVVVSGESSSSSSCSSSDDDDDDSVPRAAPPPPRRPAPKFTKLVKREVYVPEG